MHVWSAPDSRKLSDDARRLIGEKQWPAFLEQGSWDLLRTIQDIRCRIDVLLTARHIGLTIRLFSSFEATLKRLNLPPELSTFIGARHGLVIVSDPTGCGKSLTIATPIQEINLSEARHIITVESSIEYRFRPLALLYSPTRSRARYTELSASLD